MSGPLEPYRRGFTAELRQRGYSKFTVVALLYLIAALSVDDVRWRAGEIVVCSKGGQRDRLPLPDDVGQALAAYCWRGRRRGKDRHLFLQVRAPYRGLEPSAVSAVVVEDMAMDGALQFRL